ncbi:MAG: penicillin-binding transpeptidase domain-containing protein [Actinobacteria bacterium]|jgi:peptidoglycan glycosyltransferase|nr:penicillin-binding transpeptidase domain-containing protein [Actinomycetota bacterium]MCL5444625.1 penicillin-binding transpeptidase domain-containing protein [Actinomycetota bacterium]
MGRRIKVAGVAISLCFAALFIQLNNVQVLRASALSHSPYNPAVINARIGQMRGDIISANGVVLAKSVAAKSGPYKYQRVYPAATATLFSQIVGYDSPVYGATGVEASYNNYLVAHTQPATNLGELFANRTSTDNVTLTITTTLQKEVEADLLSIPGHPPNAGAVVLDPHTGAILAMAGIPSFDPTPLVAPSAASEIAGWNALNPKSPTSPLLSRAFQLTYFPGSTFKVVTTSAVFDHDPALATKNYPITGCISLPQSNLPLCNYGHGAEKCGRTIQYALPQSCDTVYAQYGMSLGAKNLVAEASAFGFNHNVPLDIPGAAISPFASFATLHKNKPYQAYSAFGQLNDQASPLMMALVTSAIANNGVIMTPHVMKSIYGSQGNLVKRFTPKPWLTATSPQTASTVTALMRRVVTYPLGTGYGVFPPNEDVAAKTGTAQTGHHTTDDWMVAFAPATSPKVVVAVAVPDQGNLQTGNSVAGPVIAKILQQALALAG